MLSTKNNKSYLVHRHNLLRKRSYLLILAIAILLSVWQCDGALAQAAHEGTVGQRSDRSHWIVIIHDRTLVARDSGRQASRANSDKWATILSDGNKTTRLNGPVVSLGTTLAYLKIKTLKEQATCTKDNFVYDYAVDQLLAQPIAGGAPRLLMGKSDLAEARKQLRYHLESCQKLLSEYPAEKSRASYDRVTIDIRSTYGSYLGLEVWKKWERCGTFHAYSDCDYATYAISGGTLERLTRRGLPSSVLREAEKLCTESQVDLLFDDSFDHFLLRPEGGVVRFDFGIPNPYGSALNGVKEVSVEHAGGLGDRYDRLRRAFVASHRGLIPWSKVDYYTVAPDLSAVVYCQNHKLYWRTISRRASLIGAVKELVGWQWHDVSRLDGREREILKLK